LKNKFLPRDRIYYYCSIIFNSFSVHNYHVTAMTDDGKLTLLYQVILWGICKYSFRIRIRNPELRVREAQLITCRAGFGSFLDILSLSGICYPVGTK
jgi:hypothetical protein